MRTFWNQNLSMEYHLFLQFFHIIKMIAYVDLRPSSKYKLQPKYVGTEPQTSLALLFYWKVEELIK